MTRGQCGWLTLHCLGLSPLHIVPVYPRTPEREALGRELARFAQDVPRIEIAGQRGDRVLRCEATSNSAAGPVRVARSLSRHPRGGRALYPLELGSGIMEGYWTPLAAKQASGAVAHLTPKESEELFARLGKMAPSKRSLDRLP